MLELRLRSAEGDKWFRYVLDPSYLFVEVDAYIERQYLKQQRVRLLDSNKQRLEFAPDVTPVVQLLCL